MSKSLAQSKTSVEKTAHLRTPEVETHDVVVRPQFTELTWHTTFKDPKIELSQSNSIARIAKGATKDVNRGVLGTIPWVIGTDTYQWFIDPHLVGDLWVGISTLAMTVSLDDVLIKQRLTIKKNTDRVFFDLSTTHLTITLQTSTVSCSWKHDLTPCLGQTYYALASNVLGSNYSVEIHQDVSTSLTASSNGTLQVNGELLIRDTCWAADAAICQLVLLAEDVSKGHMLVPYGKEPLKVVRSVDVRADRVVGVAVEDGVAGQYIRMAVGGVFDLLATVVKIPGPPPPPPPGVTVAVGSDFWADQGLNFGGYEFPGVATLFPGGVAGDDTYVGTFAMIIENKLAPFGATQEPTLFKCRFKKAELY